MAEHSKSGPGTEGGAQLLPRLVAQAQAVAGNNGNAAAEPDFHRDSEPSNNETHSISQARQPAGSMLEVPVEDAPPPAYSESYGLVDMSQLGLKTRANVASKKSERQ